METFEIKHEERYRNWLAKNGKNGTGSADYYVSKLRKVQRCFNAEIVDLLKDGVGACLDKITVNAFPGALKELANLKSVVKSYHQFFSEEFDKIPFKRKDDFKIWLVQNGVSNGVDSYVSHINGIQKTLRVDIDEFLQNGLDISLAAINNKNFRVAPSVISDKRAILKKYHQYLQSLN